MEGDEIELIAQLLLESRTGAYIDSLLVMLSAKKETQQTIKLCISLGVEKLFPLVR